MTKYRNAAIISFLILMHVWFLFESARYFSQTPAELIYVIAIALFGGLAFAVYGALPPFWQYRTLLILLGAAASGCSVFSVLVFLQGLKIWNQVAPGLSLQDKLTFIGIFGCILLMCLAIAVYFGNLFFQVLKRHRR